LARVAFIGNTVRLLRATKKVAQKSGQLVIASYKRCHYTLLLLTSSTAARISKFFQRHTEQ